MFNNVQSPCDKDVSSFYYDKKTLLKQSILSPAPLASKLDLSLPYKETVKGNQGLVHYLPIFRSGSNNDPFSYIEPL